MASLWNKFFDTKINVWACDYNFVGGDVGMGLKLLKVVFDVFSNLLLKP